MKYSRWLSIGAAILFCLCLSAPLNAYAASSEKIQTKSHKIIVKKSASSERYSKDNDKKDYRKSGKKHKADELKGKKRAKDSKAQDGKKKRKEEPVAHKSKHKRQTAEAVKNKKTVAAKEKTHDSERDIWLKRASESELFKGKASWYGRDFHKKPTASGLAYDMHTFTAAHRTLPMGTVVRVTEQKNGKSVIVCVTDRGPYVRGRIIDVSYAAAKQIGLKDRGVCKVELEVVGDKNGAPIKNDHAYFVKYKEKGHNRVGPFKAFADAAAMHEALRQAHPEAEVVLEKTTKP